MCRPILTLKQFMLRQEVLKQYRSFLRCIRQIPDEHYRTEMLEWVRTDFRTNRNHSDELTIKMLLSHGQRSLRELQTTINLSK